MNFNLFNRNKGPVSKKENTKIVRAYAEADPAAYSTLSPEAIEVVGTEDHYGYTVVQDTHGNRYVDMTEKAVKTGPTEQVITSLLKGIMSVSDVVHVQSETGPKYYSKIMELGKTKTSTLQEIEAEIALVRVIFNDVDHVLNNGERDHNLVRDKSRTKVFFFDFGNAQFGFWASNTRYLDPIPSLDAFELQHLVQKLELFKERLSGEEGVSFVRSIVERTGKSVPELFLATPATDPESALKVFHTKLLERTNDALTRAYNAQSGLKKVA